MSFSGSFSGYFGLLIETCQTSTPNPNIQRIPKPNQLKKSQLRSQEPVGHLLLYIYYTFSLVFSKQESDEFIKKYKSYCGGRAPGGICGTAYVCSQLLGKDLEDMVMATLQEFAGDTHCKIIKEKNIQSCKNILYLMTDVLEKNRKWWLNIIMNINTKPNNVTYLIE